MVTMRITVAIIVAEGEGPRKDYARLWRRVWLVVAAWISVSSRGKWRKGERGRAKGVIEYACICVFKGQR